MTERFIDFYFGFISPYGYFAAMQIEELADRYRYTVRWHVFRLGVAVVKVMGLRPMMETPLKSTYVLRDLQRLSLVFGLPFAGNDRMPDSVLLGSAFHAVKQENPQCVAAFSKQLFARIWGNGESFATAQDLNSLVQSLGLDAKKILSPATMEQGRKQLSDATTRALERGVFGSPMFAVKDELIWGVDRMWMLERYLCHGQWSMAV